MKRWERLGPRSRAQMSKLPGPRPLHTHIPPLCDPGPRPLEKCPGAGGGELRSAAPHTSVGEDGGGAGAGEAQGGRGGGKRRPGRGAGGGGGAADAEARDARGGRRLREAAGRGALEARPARGESQELHEVSPGPRTGRCPGEAVGGSPTPMARRGPRRRARSKSGLGASGEGSGLELGRVTPGLTGAGGLFCLGVSQRRLFGAPWSRQPRAARLRGFFGNLQMFS